MQGLTNLLSKRDSLKAAQARNGQETRDAFVFVPTHVCPKVLACRGHLRRRRGARRHLSGCRPRCLCAQRYRHRGGHVRGNPVEGLHHGEFWGNTYWQASLFGRIGTIRYPNPPLHLPDLRRSHVNVNLGSAIVQWNLGVGRCAALVL